MSNKACATIDIQALRHNLRQVVKLAQGRHILAMIKADGYGHGMVRVARALQGVDAFGVASVEEAISLREAQVQEPIVVMSRFDHVDQVPLCLQHHFAVVVHQPYQVDILEKTPLSEPIMVWLKLETGMHRLGLLPDQFVDAWQRLQRLAWVKKPMGLMTHLACADTLDHSLTLQQIALFEKLTADFPGPKSLANSAAILSARSSLGDWVRPGIMLYGASPFADQTGEQWGLQPVMTFSSHLNALRVVRRNDWVGYGATWQCPEDMSMGIVAIGYGDGYPRSAVSGTPVLINGRYCPLIGRVSMDMVAVDLRNHPTAKIGDSVILWGKGLPAEQIAAYAQTVSYELFCHLTRRVEFTTHG